jgi:hypothetical protein
LGPRFSDVTFDEDAPRHADQLPEPRAAFLTLGFRQVGLLGDNPIPGEAVWVHEVFTAANEEAFLTLGFSPPDPLVFRPRSIPTSTLHTALQNGSLIVTTTCPEYLRFLNHPKAGSYLEGCGVAAPSELWQLHGQRVDTISRERNSPALRHDSMRLRIQIADRCVLISYFVARWVVLSVALVLLGSGISLVGMMHRLGVQFQAWFGIPLALLGSTALGIGAMWTARNQVVRGWLGGEWLARQLPWPGKKPFDPDR